jgi:alpha-L-rhamnosidase
MRKFHLIFACIVLFGLNTTVRAEVAAPVKLTVSEGFENPIGFYDATPSFSWQIPPRGDAKAQKAYQIIAATSMDLLSTKADIWDSGKVESDQSVWIPYAGLSTLTSGQKVFWRVKFWDEEGRESEWSAPASFELGLLNNSDWKGKWLRMGEVKSKKFTPEYFRRQFSLKGSVNSARLHVTAKGLYEVYLNGVKVGKDFMVPGFTPYQKRIETLTYDVTDMLHEGENIIGAIIGEGWYAGPLMAKRLVYPDVRPMLLVQLEITLSDESQETIVTDNTWKACNTGPIRYSSIYHGEVYDANMEIPSWNSVGFDDSGWAEVIQEDVMDNPLLVPKRHYPVRAAEELQTVKITEPAPGHFVFDLGQNMVGWPRLNIPVKKGKKITIRFAEMLNKDGTLYTANYRSAHSTAYYTPAKNGTISWHPIFTFFGFRYVELTGLPKGIKPEGDWVTGVVLHSAFPQSGRFTSSHKLLTKLQENITWGQRGNYLDIPTDCPQRDERLGWTGDAQVFCPTSLFNYDVHSFWMSWLQSIREEQRNGLIPHVVPDTGMGAGSPGWGDVGVVAPWDVYVRTGNPEVLEENYDMMVQWTAAYSREAKDFIVKRQGFGDWLVPYNKGTGHDYIATAYFGRCARIMHLAATVLGKAEDEATYKELHSNIREAVSSKFFDTKGKLHKETQTGYLMFLGYDLVTPDLRNGAVDNLVKLIKKAGGHLGTGFLGTPLIALVLEEEGHADVAYDVVFKETYPSWFYSIHQGATTMWERWNSYSRDKGFGDASMNSFNHYAYGAIGQWMYEHVAGLAPDEKTPGYKHFFIQPDPGGPLTYAAAELETPYGKAASGWEQDGQDLIIKATVPANTTATLIVPCSGEKIPTVLLGGKKCNIIKREGKFIYDIGPGTYEFTVND